jgi:hypothetical protein
MAMDATTVDARPTNAASTMDDAKVAGINALPRHMDAYSTTWGQYSGATTNIASSSKKVTTTKTKAIRGVR